MKVVINLNAQNVKIKDLIFRKWFLILVVDEILIKQKFVNVLVVYVELKQKCPLFVMIAEINVRYVIRPLIGCCYKQWIVSIKSVIIAYLSINIWKRKRKEIPIQVILDLIIIIMEVVQ